MKKKQKTIKISNMDIRVLLEVLKEQTGGGALWVTRKLMHMQEYKYHEYILQITDYKTGEVIDSCHYSLCDAFSEDKTQKYMNSVLFVLHENWAVTFFRDKYLEDYSSNNIFYLKVPKEKKEEAKIPTFIKHFFVINLFLLAVPALFKKTGKNTYELSLEHLERHNKIRRFFLG